MSQFDFGNLESPLSGTTFINSKLEPWRDALHSTHKGNARPSYAIEGTQWINDTSSKWVLNVFDGSEDIALGVIDTDNNLFIPNNTSRYAGTAAGSANALTLTPTPAITALAVGDVFDFIVGSTNTAAAPTLAISGLDPETIKANLGAGKVGVPKGALVTGTPMRVFWDGTDFVLMNVRPNNCATDIATAGTVNLNAATGDYVTLTGTTTITAITLAEGQQRMIKAAGIFILTNGASLIIPGAANITTAAGDVFVVRGEASGVVRVVSYVRASGESIVAGASGGETMHVQDQKSSGTDGGTFSSGADRTRTLNTVVKNTITGASLSSNQVTLPAGDYEFIGNAPCYAISNNQLILHNATDSADVQRGISSTTRASTATQETTWISGAFTIAAPKAFELRHRSGGSQSGNGFGQGASFGTEVFADLKFTKVG